MAKKCNIRIVYLNCLNIDWKGAPYFAIASAGFFVLLASFAVQ